MISKKCSYALRAVLALSRNTGGKPLTIHQIAESEGIPARFLEAILRDLKQSGLTESLRGKEGGYRLLGSPRELSVGQVIRAVEGPWLDVPTEAADEVFSPMWEELQNNVNELVDSLTFQQLLSREDTLRRSAVSDYSI